MPLYRRLPHITGFQVVNRRQWLELNVGDLEGLLLPGENTVTPELLTKLGLYNPLRMDGVRVLGHGDLSLKITLQVHYVTPSAKAKIEAAGGQVSLIGA
jgi:large subunit ribosomal protein L15